MTLLLQPLSHQILPLIELNWDFIASFFSALLVVKYFVNSPKQIQFNSKVFFICCLPQIKWRTDCRNCNPAGPCQEQYLPKNKRALTSVEAAAQRRGKTFMTTTSDNDNKFDNDDNNSDKDEVTSVGLWVALLAETARPTKLGTHGMSSAAVQKALPQRVYFQRVLTSFFATHKRDHKPCRQHILKMNTAFPVCSAMYPKGSRKRNCRYLSMHSLQNSSRPTLLCPQCPSCQSAFPIHFHVSATDICENRRNIFCSLLCQCHFHDFSLL